VATPFDPVHDTQRTYRELVRALSRPGTIVDLAEIADRLSPRPPFNPVILLIAQTLLDGETTFALADGDGAADAADTISKRTYARNVAVSEASFVFVLGAETDPVPVLNDARDGTLVDPHLGATVIIEARALRDVGAYQLTGPGVDCLRTIAIEPTSAWLEARNERTREYPLGIDCFFVDGDGRVAGIPRTTRIERREDRSWAT
jgi:alpha-D-ribose 1-methylphosphonate 5-triphosphate synthase subunit PhnH